MAYQISLIDDSGSTDVHRTSSVDAARRYIGANRRRDAEMVIFDEKTGKQVGTGFDLNYHPKSRADRRRFNEARVGGFQVTEFPNKTVGEFKELGEALAFTKKSRSKKELRVNYRTNEGGLRTAHKRTGNLKSYSKTKYIPNMKNASTSVLKGWLKTGQGSPKQVNFARGILAQRRKKNRS